MVRVVTQETFDEVVKENIEEFDMSPEEAVKEATAQFQAQGVDLSNIIKDLTLGLGDHQVITVVKTLKEICIQDEYDDEQVIKELTNLQVECNKDIAHRVKAAKEGAYNILIDLLEARLKRYIEKPSDGDRKMIVSVLNTLVALMDVQPDLLEQRGVDLIMSSLDNIDNEYIIAATLRWANICCIKHEMNRQRIFAKNIAKSLQTVLKLRASVKIASEAMQLARKFTLDDDIRVEFGKAHEHARELGIKLLEPLTTYLKENPNPPIVSETMLTIAALLVRAELCAMAADGGASAALLHILADNFDNAIVVAQASKLITALAGNDDVKRNLMKAGIAPIIVALLNRHGSNATVGALLLKCIAALTLRETSHSQQFFDTDAAEAIIDCLKANPDNEAVQQLLLLLKCIAALTLREPSHSQQFFDTDAAEAIIDCLKANPDNEAVQKNGCWAIRNMVARCREQNPKFHELGVESILNASYDKFGADFGYDIKSALRDLECDVKFNEQWTGKGVQMED